MGNGDAFLVGDPGHGHPVGDGQHRAGHRCGGVFFPAGTPLEVPTGQLLPALAFRQLVWTAAGY
jgi:hypothetical protein